MENSNRESLPVFYKVIEEFAARNSHHILLDQDFNKGCNKIYDQPIEIIPIALTQNQIYTPYQNPQILNVYHHKADAENYLKKAELLNG